MSGIMGGMGRFPGFKVWKCLNCGHLHVGEKAPKICPVCKHPQSYFEEQVVNY